VIGGQHVLVVVGAGNLTRVTGADFLTADDDGDIYYKVALALEFSLKSDALGRTGHIGLHRLVGGKGKVDSSVIHLFSC
jgi:hypothetical protein